MSRKLFTPDGLVFDSDEHERRYRFDQAADAERAGHEAKGYTAEHDAEHGPVHLIAWAYEYTVRGDRHKAAAMLLALKDLIEDRDRENRAIGWDEGFDAGEKDAWDVDITNEKHVCPANPYRGERP